MPNVTLDTPAGTNVWYSRVTDPDYYPPLVGRMGTVSRSNGLDLLYVDFDDEAGIPFYVRELTMQCEGVLETRQRREEDNART